MESGVGAIEGYPVFVNVRSELSTFDSLLVKNGDDLFWMEIGQVEVVLSESNLPSHWHYTAYGSDSQGGYDEANGRIYIGGRCTNCIYGDPNWNYNLGGTSNVPNAFRSASVGSGLPVNIMQPTIYAGNLFIFAS